jgi:nitrite reductase/ring-hydroxylating ferredoxin subunit
MVIQRKYLEYNMREKIIGRVEDFPEGKGTEVRLSGLRVAIFNIDGELYAIHGSCPHKHAPLHESGENRYNSEKCGGPFLGEIDSGSKMIKCPWHGLRFNLETGESPMLRRKIPVYNVIVREDGEVAVVV